VKGVALAAALFAAGPAAAACRADIAEFMWDGGGARFGVEIADDEAERAQGLMNRESLPAGSGMLFVYDRPQDVAFWMKNTLIPLDMIFIDDAGRVTDVHENAVPGDLTPIPGPQDTLLVLEIRGGLAARLGLGEGAVLRHPALDPAEAAWPCE
jgi:uncharacterized protein